MPESTAGRPLDRIISGDANPAYVAFHRPRFRFLIETLRPYASRRETRLLDIGASYLTSLLKTELEVSVDSLGLEADRHTDGVRNYRFDLNDAQYRERWRTEIGPYDVIVFAEVLEHLYTAPELVLAFLKELLTPTGVLVIQTPNAVALRKRARMLLGLHPFERIRVDRHNPGHFDVRYSRDDTGNEPARPIDGAIRNALYRLLPGSFREGITIVAHKA